MKTLPEKLTKSLKMAYSAERAAAFAYVGHAGSLRDVEEITHVRAIEQDEWHHRAAVLEIMQIYGIQPSLYFELKFYCIGKLISASCYVIGRFMPYFFAGKLESGNVCEYFVMLQEFRKLGIHRHDTELYAMGVKEKEHEVYFAELIADAPWLPLFEKVFAWGPKTSLNDVDLEALYPMDEVERYCKKVPSNEP